MYVEAYMRLTSLLFKIDLLVGNSFAEASAE